VTHQEYVDMKTASSSTEQRSHGGRMKKSLVKRILGAGALALALSVGASAAPRVIDIEPEECQVRCFYIMGVPFFCYEVCF
jgi:hypothetical protein